MRLVDQAMTLTELLHHDTHYPAGARVLEAGCGVGAQTVTLAARSPGAAVLSIDIASASIAAARERVRAAGVTNVTFQQADLYALPFAPNLNPEGLPRRGREAGDALLLGNWRRPTDHIQRLGLPGIPVAARSQPKHLRELRRCRSIPTNLGLNRNGPRTRFRNA